MAPAISVLVPVRNALPYLGASMRSLERQSLRDVEVIAVDDGSTDGSGDALDRMSRRDPRLRVVHEPARGLPAALNRGLALARAPLIARHDADDLSHCDRLDLQRGWLAEHPHAAIVGSRLRLFPAGAVGAGMRRWAEWHNRLLTHEQMANECLIDSPLAHGTAMIRREWLERVGGWADRGWAEDLDLWIRLLEAGARFGKVPRVLYGWRQHRASATRRDPRYRRERFIALKLDALERGPLRGATAMTLVGVGESLARCIPVFEAGRTVLVVEAGRPSASVMGRLVAPVVLVFMSYSARERWRQVLVNARWREQRDFIFIA
jgi:glycosyltransferase involved in cell wall biosynthesis